MSDEFYTPNLAKSFWNSLFGIKAKSKVTLLREDEHDANDLVPAKFYIIGVENLIDFEFISGIFENKSKDDSLYESVFIRNFIDYAWD